jgi:IS5 family transposase
VAELEATAAAVEAIAAQTRVRLAGGVPDGSTRVVSLHDGDARPIRKGRLGRPVEFGYKAQVADNTDGVVLDYVVVKGNPADAPMLAPAIARIARRAGVIPKAVTADRGYGEAGVDAELEQLGVRKVCIHRKGRPGAARHKVQGGRGFRAMVKWRTGSEARISCLKRDFGWRRTLCDGLGGAQTWCGWGVLAHNSLKIARLIETQDNTGPDGHNPTTLPAGSSPPTPSTIPRPAA